MTRNLRTALLIIVALATASGCSESSREKATGKASILAVNTIVDSPDLTFKIEERSLGSVAFGGSSPAARYDDLNYNFNFDLDVPGGSETQRIATLPLDVMRNRVYLLVLTGDLDNSDIILFDEEERVWDGTESVFELSFAHMNNTQGEVDVYFAADGVAPAAGNEVARIANGERSGIIEYASGDYVITITTAGDPQDVLYMSNVRTYQPSSTDTIFLFDQDPSLTSDLLVRLISGNGGTTQLPDPRLPPVARLIHAAADIAAVDVYENDDFASPLLANQAFGDITEDIALTAGTNDYTWTDAGNTGAIILEEQLPIISGLRVALVLVGPASEPDALNLTNIRRPFATSGRISFANAAANFENVDIYLLPAGESIDDAEPSAPNFPFKFVQAMTAVAADNYEITITVENEKTVLAGPLALDIAVRDVIDVLLLDTADPNVLDIRVIRNTP